jgi:hypothetical protein
MTLIFVVRLIKSPINYAANNFSFAKGMVSKKVRSEVRPKHQRPWWLCLASKKRILQVSHPLGVTLLAGLGIPSFCLDLSRMASRESA